MKKKILYFIEKVKGNIRKKQSDTKRKVNLKNILSSFQGTKIGRKLFILFLLFSVIPVLVIGVFSYRTSSTIISDKVGDVTQELLTQVARNFELQVDELLNVSFSIITNPELSSALREYGSGGDSYDDFAARRQIQDYLNYQINTNSNLVGVSIITQEDSFHSSQNKFSQDTESFTQFINYIKEERKVSWSVIQNEDVSRQSLIFGRPINVFNSNSRTAVLLIEINPAMFHNTLSEISLGDTGFLSVVNTGGSLISHSDMGSIDNISSDFAENILSNNEIGLETISFVSSENELITSKEILNTDWILYSSVPISELTTETAEIRNVTVLIGILTIIISTIVAMFVARDITNALRDVTRKMKEVENGNLDSSQFNTKKKRKDEIGDLVYSLENMVIGIRNIITSATSTANAVSISSKKLFENATLNKKLSSQTNEVMNEVAQLSQETAASTEESVTAIDSINADIQKIAEVSTDVSNNSIVMIEEAKQGQDYIDTAINKIGQVYHTVNESAEIMGQLDKRADDIVKITEMITKLSDQTNLLALNAAIEAARAGEHGLGFSVVADEVRKLAHQSKEATLEIDKVIKEIQESTKTSVSRINKGRAEVEEGSKAVEVAGGKFQQLVTSIEQVSDQIQDVTGIIQQISASSEEVSATVYTMSDHAQKSTVMAQEVQKDALEQLVSIDEASSSAEELEEISQELMKKIKFFKV
ncbi:methyl-accepting chemotaxis protein [Evansella sp. AB-rgal1]|uniref:methyl-accepting chemotaxis protein n=1 Tax=Evansella sp. AB-rgal1 TaxID=3242696 RepID=UPI00359D4F2E